MQSLPCGKAVELLEGRRVRGGLWRVKRKAGRLALGKSGQIQLGDDEGWAGRVAVRP